MFRWWTVVTLGLVVVTLLAFGVWPFETGTTFDPDVWKDENRIAEGVRTAIADRLVAQRVLLSKTRAEVIEMLGEPTWEEAERLSYLLGPYATVGGVDAEWLTVIVGQDGRVAHCRRWHD